MGMAGGGGGYGGNCNFEDNYVKFKDSNGGYITLDIELQDIAKFVITNLCAPN